jgi:hypothetical protein
MSATAEQIAQMRRLIAEPTDATYTDAMIVQAIEARPVRDAAGQDPLVWSYLTTPATQIANTYWTPTYSLYAAAADIWDEKAAAVACDFDFSADGASYDRAKVFEQYTKMAKRFRGRAGFGSARLVSSQREIDNYGRIVEVEQDLPRYTPPLEPVDV